MIADSRKRVMLREGSFGALLDRGWTKEQLMERFCLSEGEYERVLGSLMKIRGVA